MCDMNPVKPITETEMAALAAEIERNRLELNDLGKILGAHHPDVLAKSQRLDELILQHMLLKCKKPTA